jgi:co-chaperonin GroES (HSP10)
MLVLRNRLLVEFDAPPKTTPSGLIYIPDSALDPSYTGIVLAIGPEQMNICVGDKIVFSRYAGIPIKNIAGEPMQAIVDESEVLAVVVDEYRQAKRTTYAITGAMLRTLVNQHENGDANEEGQLIYANYKHENDTIYLTFETIEDRFELQLEGTGLDA